MAEGSSTFIRMIAEGRRKQKEFQSGYMKFRKRSILSNLKDDPHDIYNLYKQREKIDRLLGTNIFPSMKKVILSSFDPSSV